MNKNLLPRNISNRASFGSQTLNDLEDELSEGENAGLNFVVDGRENDFSSAETGLFGVLVPIRTSSVSHSGRTKQDAKRRETADARLAMNWGVR
jgi:hypothetical protein